MLWGYTAVSDHSAYTMGGSGVPLLFDTPHTVLITPTKLGPPVVPFYPFLGEGSPTKIDYRRKGILTLSSLLEDLEKITLKSKFISEAARFAARGPEDLRGIPAQPGGELLALCGAQGIATQRP